VRTVFSAATTIALPIESAGELSELPRGPGDPVARYVRRGPDGATVLLWSAPPEHTDARLLAAATLRWRTPSSGWATVTRLSWDLAQGGSEAKARAALDSLVDRIEGSLALTGTR
jgi:hypothetical protein